MLEELQVKRLLEHCKNVNNTFEKMQMCGDEGTPYFDYMKNKGWIDALTLVLKDSSEPIRRDPLDEDK